MTTTANTNTYEDMQAAWDTRDADAKVAARNAVAYREAAPVRAAWARAEAAQAAERAADGLDRAEAAEALAYAEWRCAEVSRAGGQAVPARTGWDHDFFAVPGVVVDGAGRDFANSATVYHVVPNSQPTEVGFVEGTPLALAIARTSAAALGVVEDAAEDLRNAHCSCEGYDEPDDDDELLALDWVVYQCGRLELAHLGFVCTISAE